MKKLLVVLMVLTLVVSMMAGCSNNNTNNNETNEQNNEQNNEVVNNNENEEDTSNSNNVDNQEENNADENTNNNTTENNQEDEEDVLEGSFTWWSYFDQTPFLKEEFNKVYPDVEIDLQVFGGDEYQTKILTTLQSGQNVPDLFDLEEGYVYKFIETDQVANLDELGARAFVDDYYDWAVAMGTDSEGNLKGICDNVSPVAFWYIRDAMEQWLGTSDNEEISKKLSTWDKILDEAERIKEESNGEVYLWPNLSEIVKVEGYSQIPFIRNGEFNIDSGWYGVMSVMRQFHERELVAQLGSWSGEWATAWNEGNLLIRTMPSWDFFTDWENNSGNVGVAKPPKASYEGGTYRAIYSGSEKKDLALKFLEFLTTADYQISNLEVNNQMPATTEVYEKIGADYSSEKFGGQNILETYHNICSSIKEIVPDKYTRDVQNIFSRHCQEGIRQELTDDEIISNFKKEVKEKYPEVNGL